MALAAVAAVLVLGGNVDTIAIASSLASNPEARGKLVDVAQQQLAVAEQLKLQAAASADGQNNGALAAATEQTRVAGETLARAALQMESSGLQFGWTSLPSRWDEILQKLAGLLVSIVAISLGAPFWFSVLQRFMQVRAAGVTPDKAK